MAGPGRGRKPAAEGREELLARARAEREARAEEKRRARAVGRVQCAWRGCRARRQAVADLAAAWDRRARGEAGAVGPRRGLWMDLVAPALLLQRLGDPQGAGRLKVALGLLLSARGDDRPGSGLAPEAAVGRSRRLLRGALGAAGGADRLLLQGLARFLNRLVVKCDGPLWEAVGLGPDDAARGTARRSLCTHLSGANHLQRMLLRGLELDDRTAVAWAAEVLAACFAAVEEEEEEEGGQAGRGGRAGLVLAVAGVPLAAVFEAIPERVAGGLNRAAVRRTVFAGVPACLGAADVRWIDSVAYLLVAADSVTAADRDLFLRCQQALFGAVDAAALRNALQGDALPHLLSAPLLATLLPTGAAGDADFGAVASLFCRMFVEAADAAHRPGRPAAADKVVNLLAFSPSFIPRAWKWLAVTCAFPHEAPEMATRGWNIASCLKGLEGFPPPQREALCIFSHALTRLLFVLDDEEFFRKGPLQLGSFRAISATMQGLCFHTLAKHRAQTSELGSLLERGCLALLKSLYERNSRRTFCPPELWLAPKSTADHLSTDSHHRPSSSLIVDPFEGLSVHNIAMQLWASIHEKHEGEAHGPVVAILDKLPQVLPFVERAKIFRAIVEIDKHRGRWNRSVADGGRRPVPITIRRNHLLEDALAQLRSVESVKARLNVTFINAAGAQEAGLDYGGLVKEFIEEVLQKGFDPNLGVFATNAEGDVVPARLVRFQEAGLDMMTMLGRVLGKAIYEGYLIDLHFAAHFAKAVLSQQCTLEDLQSLDAELYRNLLSVKFYEGDVADLCLDFTATVDVFGRSETHELCENGANVEVTNANRSVYIHLLSHLYLNQNAEYTAAFVSGLATAVDPKWLHLFNDPQELNKLVAGELQSLDVEDLRAHTEYAGGYTSSSTTVKLFCKVLRSCSADEQQRFLKFVTSSSRAPLLGFAHLNPPFTISKVSCETSIFAAFGGKDADRLPTASTCFHLLKLPNFKVAKNLRAKLLLAINSGTGFELS